MISSSRLSRILACSLILTFVAEAAHADLIAVSATSGNPVVELDRTTGNGTLIGPTGLASVQSLAFDSNSNAIFGVDVGTDVLAMIDRQTGTATQIGPVGFDVITSMEYVEANDTLYGIARVNNGTQQQLVTFNRQTGSASTFGNVSNEFTSGLAFGSPDNVFYTRINSTNELASINPFTGVLTTIGALNASIESLAFDNNGVLYGYDANQFSLVSIDPTTANVNQIGPAFFGSLRGMTFVPIPEPSTSIAIIAVFAVLSGRRRTDSPQR